MDKTARKIVATLIQRKRLARQRVAKAHAAGHQREIINLLEAEYTEAHNAAEVARRILYFGGTD